MKVINKEEERIKSKCSEKELGEALSALDLNSIPPEHRHMAIRSRLAEVMMATTSDPKERGKDAQASRRGLHRATAAEKQVSHHRMSKNQNAPETGALVADLSDADLAALLLQVRAAEEGFEGFVRLLHPEWKIPDYQLAFIDILDKLERRTLVNNKGEPVHNLLVNMPPRHNKSTLATKLFPAYCIARAPWTKILCRQHRKT